MVWQNFEARGAPAVKQGFPPRAPSGGDLQAVLIPPRSSGFVKAGMLDFFFGNDAGKANKTSKNYPQLAFILFE